jgi:hypothetical protein
VGDALVSDASRRYRAPRSGSFQGTGIEIEAGKRRESRLVRARSFTDRAKLVYAKRAASGRANQSVRQRTFYAHEYMTTAPFVVDPGDYGRILFDAPRANVG